MSVGLRNVDGFLWADAPGPWRLLGMGAITAITFSGIVRDLVHLATEGGAGLGANVAKGLSRWGLSAPEQGPVFTMQP